MKHQIYIKSYVKLKNVIIYRMTPTSGITGSRCLEIPEVSWKYLNRVAPIDISKPTVRFPEIS